MDAGARQDDALDPDEWHEYVDRQQHADNRAECVHRIDRADGSFAGAATHEFLRQQRKVMPAQNVAGIMISAAIAWLITLNATYPPAVWVEVPRTMP